MQERTRSSRSSRAGRGAQGERRVITVLFCDVTGSTAFAEHLDPEEWTEIMNEAFDYMIQPVIRYEGTVARLMGDGILAFFGAPVAHEDDPQRAILAGLDILDGVTEFRQELLDEYGMDFNVRIGVNTGPVVVGDVGSEQAGEYTAMGDAVNLAARMEQTAGPGMLQISEDTQQLVAPLFELESLGDIEVKGKAESVPAYRVVRPKSQPGRLRGIEGLAAPLIGRSEELETLKSLLAQTREGRGGIASLIGEAGLGKSRLLDELQAEWGDSATWIVNRAASYDVTRPYSLFQQRLLQVFNVEDRDPPDIIRRKIETQPQGLTPQTHATVASAVEAILEIRSDSDSVRLQGEALKDQVYDACHQMWRADASNAPTVMVLDDMHWSDQASADLLIDLLPLVEEVPLFILCAFRPERQSPAWKARQESEANFPHVYTELTLNPLNDEDSNTLVNSLLTIADLPGQTRDVILQKTDGNPFFVEEVVRSLIDSGAVYRDEDAGIWRAGQEIANIEIPDNLQGLITARMDRLDPDARRAMQMASVIGRNFQRSVLEAVWDSDASLDRQLSTLQRAGLVIETARTPEREYAFRHELTRDAAYASVLRRRRRQFHRGVANAMEELLEDRIEEQAHRLAHHFSEAMDKERGLKYSTIAGDHALRMYANSEAADHYRRAMDLAKTMDASSENLIYLCSSRATALQESARFEDLIDHCKEFEALAIEHGDTGLELASLVPQAIAHSTYTAVRDQQKGEEITQRTLELARSVNDPRAESKALWLLLLLHSYGSAEFDKAIEYGLQSLSIAREHSFTEEEAFNLNDLGRAYHEIGDMDRAIELGTEARELWVQLNNKPMLVDNYVASAMSYYETGNLTACLENTRFAIELSLETGNLWGQAGALGAAVLPHLDMGEIERFIDTGLRSMELVDQIDMGTFEVALKAILGWGCGTVGQIGEGLEHLKTAELDDGSVESVEFNWFAHIITAYLHLLKGDTDRANDCIVKAYGNLDMNEPKSSFGIYFGAFQFLPATVNGEVLWLLGKHEKLRDFAESSRQLMESRQNRIFALEMMRLKGQAEFAIGLYDEARKTLTLARDRAQEFGAKRHLWPVLLYLSKVEQALGNPRSEDHLDQSRQIVQQISDTIENSEFRQAFLTLPHVQEVLGTA
ncbi:MAG: adenylate/guanylate cyclase domain-containing protein [SAR202 cluster bacterium]|nr:adenylate/guanylate cyclase domain-containing protein [SAR202 cluster bacterium]